MKNPHPNDRQATKADLIQIARILGLQISPSASVPTVRMLLREQAQLIKVERDKCQAGLSRLQRTLDPSVPHRDTQSSPELLDNGNGLG